MVKKGYYRNECFGLVQDNNFSRALKLLGVTCFCACKIFSSKKNKQAWNCLDNFNMQYYLHWPIVLITSIYNGCSPVNLLYIFRTPFSKNTSGGLLLDQLWSSFNSLSNIIALTEAYLEPCQTSMTIWRQLTTLSKPLF